MPRTGSSSKKKAAEQLVEELAMKAGRHLSTTTLSTAAAAAAKVHPADSLPSSNAASAHQGAHAARSIEAVEGPAKGDTIRAAIVALDGDAGESLSENESVEEKEDVDSDGTEEEIEDVDREAVGEQHRPERRFARGSGVRETDRRRTVWSSDRALWETLDVDNSNCVSLRDLAKFFFMTGTGTGLERKACLQVLRELHEFGRGERNSLPFTTK